MALTPPHNKIPSPCVRNCCLDDDDVCLGCFRTIEEIIAWGDASDDEKQVILLSADERRQKKQIKY